MLAFGILAALMAVKNGGSGQVVVVLRQVEKAKHAEPIVDCNHHHVALGGKDGAVVVVAGTDVVGAAVNPEHNGKTLLTRFGRCVDVQDLAVMTGLHIGDVRLQFLGQCKVRKKQKRQHLFQWSNR